MEQIQAIIKNKKIIINLKIFINNLKKFKKNNKYRPKIINKIKM